MDCKSLRHIQDTPKEIKEHLEQCPSCYEDFQWSNHTREAFSELERTEIPNNLHQTIMTALESEMPIARKSEVKSWFSFLQWKPVLSFAAASVLIVALATMHYSRPEPVQTMELLQPKEPETSMRALTKEEAEAVTDSMNMMLVPPAAVSEDGFLEIFLELDAEEFASWQEFLGEKEIPYQRIETDDENQLIIEGTGNDLVELNLELKNALKLQDELNLPEFVAEEDIAVGTREEEQVVVMKLQQSYRVIFLLKQK